MAKDTPTHLQAAIRQAVALSGKSRDHFDALIQKQFGTSGKPIYDIDRGKSKSPSMETIERIASVFELPVSFFLERREPMRTPANSGVAPDLPPVVGASDGDGGIVIRQVDLSYAMGDGANIEDYPEETGQLFDPNFLRALTRAPASKLIVARGDGDSMQPTLINDDTVLIDTSQRVLNMQDRIWACGVHGAGMIKRLRVVGEGRVEVRSDNKTVGDREVDAADLVIVGRVIWVGRRV